MVPDTSTATTGPSSPPASGAITGMLGGSAFAFRDGAAYVGPEGAVDLVLSDRADLCSSFERRTSPPGATLVQAYGLQGKLGGAFKNPDGDDVKYAVIATACPSGAPVERNIAHASDANAATFTISKIGASSVSGTLDVTFKDGSTVSGSFEIHTCSMLVGDDATCS